MQFKKSKFQFMLAFVMLFALVTSSCSREDVLEEVEQEAMEATVNGPQLSSCGVSGPPMTMMDWLPEIQAILHGCHEENDGPCIAFGNVTSSYSVTDIFFIGSLVPSAAINTYINSLSDRAQQHKPMLNKFSPQDAMWAIENIQLSAPQLLPNGFQFSITMNVTYRRLTCPVESALGFP